MPDQNQPAIDPPDKDAQQRGIGERLREARDTLGITQEDAASALRIPRTSIVSIEKGARNVTATELSAMSTLYRRSVPWILGQESSAIDKTTALFRATDALSETDKAQVLRFAQFLATAGSPPKHPEA